jgi:hypothetical protein
MFINDWYFSPEDTYAGDIISYESLARVGAITASFNGDEVMYTFFIELKSGLRCVSKSCAKEDMVVAARNELLLAWHKAMERMINTR